MCTQGQSRAGWFLRKMFLIYVYMYTVKLEALPLGQGMYRESFTVCDVDVAINYRCTLKMDINVRVS